VPTADASVEQLASGGQGASGESQSPQAASSEQPALLPIGAVAREVGLTARAIRYYEEAGLLRPAIRVKGADRLFDASDVQRLRDIKRLREVIGFSLAEIAALLETDEMRQELRERFYGTTDATVHVQVIRDAIRLAEKRLGIVEYKLEQVAAVRDEEAQRLARLQEMLAAKEGQETTGTDRRQGEAG
jgi:DNA-binding transcriptional MerR regulator